MQRILSKIFPVYRLLIMLLSAFVLFLGGIVILFSRIPGWDLFFGLVLTPVGAILIILTMDEAARKIFVPLEFKMTKCNVCQKNTFAYREDNKTICGNCREKEIDQLLKEGSIQV